MPTETVLLRVWSVGAFWPEVRLSLFSGIVLQRVSARISASIRALTKAKEVTSSILFLSYLSEDFARALRFSAQRTSKIG